jgi:hypothetical protein
VARPLTAATRPGHLGEHADTDHPEHRRPGERQPEARANLGVGDQVADVDEATDRRQDPQRDREELLHGFTADT